MRYFFAIGMLLPVLSIAQIKGSPTVNRCFTTGIRSKSKLEKRFFKEIPKYRDADLGQGTYGNGDKLGPCFYNGPVLVAEIDEKGITLCTSYERRCYHTNYGKYEELKGVYCEVANSLPELIHKMARRLKKVGESYGVESGSYSKWTNKRGKTKYFDCVARYRDKE